MARARRNPIGLPAPEGTTLVRVGKYGKQTHIYHPVKHIAICRSGASRAEEGQDLYGVDPRKEHGFVTCYRCAKLGELNLEDERPIWKGPPGIEG